MKFLKYLIIFSVGIILSVAFATKFAFIKTTSVALISLMLAYSYKYWKNGVDAELAYWLIFYASFGITLLGVGLLQTHYECLNLIGECYSGRLPPWLFEFKIIWKVLLSFLNAASIISSVLIISALKHSTK